MRRFLLALGVLVAGMQDAPAQQGEQRIALIIANDAYASPNLGRLPGTQRDAALMHAALERAGFAVTLRANLSRAQMRNEFSSFANRLALLGDRGVGFLYYAGHGVADGPRGQNYLVPVDAHISGVPDLPATSIPLNEELDGIALSGARATILVIDACRNTPVALRRGSRGLAAVDARTDTLIAFATDAGETATDDGIYARVLSEELQQPGADAVAVFARVQTRVAQATNRGQRPRFETGLLGEPIVFVASPQTAVGTQAAPLPTPPVVQQWAAGMEFDDCSGAGWCPRMVVIPAGRFSMGSTGNELGREPREGPVRRVEIARFAAGKFEVTFDQWSECVQRGGCPRLGQESSGAGAGSHPVINVSWNDARAYLDWLSQATGRSYRLLTEAEWEYAARALSDTPYPWGASASHDYANYGLDVCCGGSVAGRDQWVNTAPVGSFPPNRFGLYDMHGNAWEWVEDCFAETLAGAPTDGSAATRAGCANHVRRGGSWFIGVDYLRSAVRHNDPAAARSSEWGFRVARSLPADG